MNFNDCKNEIWETVSNLPKTEILERIPSIPELCKLGWTPSSLIQEIKKHPIISFKSRDDIASEEDFGRVEFVSRDGCNLKGWSYKKNVNLMMREQLLYCMVFYKTLKNLKILQ